MPIDFNINPFAIFKSLSETESDSGPESESGPESGSESGFNP